MLLLTSTSDIVRLVTADAGDIEVHAAYVDNLAGVLTPGRNNPASITTATTTTLVGSPAASTQRSVRFISLRNNHASQSVDCTIEHTDGTNSQTIHRVILQSGEIAIMNDNGIWKHYDPHGGWNQGQYISLANDLVILGRSPFLGASQLMGVKPSQPKLTKGASRVWCKAGVSGNNLAGYNISSIGDNGPGNIQFNFSTSFANSSYSAQLNIERPNTTMTVTNTQYISFRTDGKSISSCVGECWDGTATTAVQEDPTAWHFFAFGRTQL